MRASAVLARNIFRMAKRVPLCRLAALALVGFTAPTLAQQQLPGEPTSGHFLEWTKERRAGWLHGAFVAVAYSAALYDKAKGSCVADWYLKDRDAKQKVIEDMMTRNPQMGPTTIVIGIAATACKGIFPGTSVGPR